MKISGDVASRQVETRMLARTGSLRFAYFCEMTKLT